MKPWLQDIRGNRFERSPNISTLKLDGVAPLIPDPPPTRFTNLSEKKKNATHDT